MKTHAGQPLIELDEWEAAANIAMEANRQQSRPAKGSDAAKQRMEKVRAAKKKVEPKEAQDDD